METMRRQCLLTQRMLFFVGWIKYVLRSLVACLTFLIYDIHTHLQHTLENELKRPVQVIKVPFAKTWENRHLENTSSGFMSDVNNIPIGGTTITSATAVVSTTASANTAALGVSTATADTTNLKSATPTSPIKSGKLLRPYDWTLSSDYCCSVESANHTRANETLDSNITSKDEVKNRKVLSARALSESLLGGKGSSSSCTDSIRVEAADSSSIEFDLLKDRDASILLYDEFLLYQVCMYVIVTLIGDRHVKTREMLLHFYSRFLYYS